MCPATLTGSIISIWIFTARTACAYQSTINVLFVIARPDGRNARHEGKQAHDVMNSSYVASKLCGEEQKRTLNKFFANLIKLKSHRNLWSFTQLSARSNAFIKQGKLCGNLFNYKSLLLFSSAGYKNVRLLFLLNINVSRELQLPTLFSCLLQRR